jgi:hypothetical protein
MPEYTWSAQILPYQQPSPLRGQVAATPAQAVAGADITLAMLSDPEACLAVATGVSTRGCAFCGCMWVGWGQESFRQEEGAAQAGRCSRSSGRPFCRTASAPQKGAATHGPGGKYSPSLSPPN